MNNHDVTFSLPYACDHALTAPPTPRFITHYWPFSHHYARFYHGLFATRRLIVYHDCLISHLPAAIALPRRFSPRHCFASLLCSQPAAMMPASWLAASICFAYSSCHYMPDGRDIFCLPASPRRLLRRDASSHSCAIWAHAILARVAIESGEAMRVLALPAESGCLPASYAYIGERLRMMSMLHSIISIYTIIVSFIVLPDALHLISIICYWSVLSTNTTPSLFTLLTITSHDTHHIFYQNNINEPIPASRPPSSSTLNTSLDFRSSGNKSIPSSITNN